MRFRHHRQEAQDRLPRGRIQDQQRGRHALKCAEIVLPGKYILSKRPIIAIFSEMGDDGNRILNIKHFKVFGNFFQQVVHIHKEIASEMHSSH